MRSLAQLVKQVPHLLHRERIVRLDDRVARIVAAMRETSADSGASAMRNSPSSIDNGAA